MPKEAWELLPTLRNYTRCRLCRYDGDFQERFWEWIRQGRKQVEIAEELSVPVSLVNRHKRHLVKVYERWLTLTAERAREVTRLEHQLRLEREKRLQLQLAREREERAKLVLDALKDFVSQEKYERIVNLLAGEGDEDSLVEG